MVVRYAVRVNGLSTLVVTKLDVLDTLEKIGLCIGYMLDGELVTEFPVDIASLEQITPHYEWLAGWNRSTADAREIEALPAGARKYLDRIEELVESPIRYVSVGTRRDQIGGL